MPFSSSSFIPHVLYSIVSWLVETYSNRGAGNPAFAFKFLRSEGIFILYFASKVPHNISKFRFFCVRNSRLATVLSKYQLNVVT